MNQVDSSLYKSYFKNKHIICIIWT